MINAETAQRGVAMNLIELTDFYSKTNKEYVNVEEIIYIEKHEQFFLVEEITEAISRGFLNLFPPKKITKTEVKGERVRQGSRILLKNDRSAYVLETPQEVANLIKGEK